MPLPDALFTLSDAEKYQNLSSYPVSTQFRDLVQRRLPMGWQLSREYIWLKASPPSIGEPPAQGFKIHVSSIPEHAADALNVVVLGCVARGVAFRVTADPDLLQIQNSSLFYRANAGKFITLYPPSHPCFLALIEELYCSTALSRCVGPYILSDRRYKDSDVLSYRYGRFDFTAQVKLDGTKVPIIGSPESETSLDESQPVFALPHWVTDPFADPIPRRDIGPVALGDRYMIEAMIDAATSGCIYAGRVEFTRFGGHRVSTASPRFREVGTFGPALDRAW